MEEHNCSASLDERINIRGEIESIRATLHERDKRYEQRFVDQERAVLASLAAAKEAVDKAEKSQERRLELLNEFRGQAADEAAKYATKESQKPLIDKIDRMQVILDKITVLGPVAVLLIPIVASTLTYLLIR